MDFEFWRQCNFCFRVKYKLHRVSQQQAQNWWCVLAPVNIIRWGLQALCVEWASKLLSKLDAHLRVKRMLLIVMPGELQSMRSQRVGHDWTIEQQLLCQDNSVRQTAQVHPNMRHSSSKGLMWSSLVLWMPLKGNDPLAALWTQAPTCKES